MKGVKERKKRNVHTDVEVQVTTVEKKSNAEL